MNPSSQAFDYDHRPHDYARIRQADPRLQAYVTEALEGMKTVVNVGAGTGSYEPTDRWVVAVEPSRIMRQKRLELGRSPALNATADALPFDDGSFDAALAVLTVHHWPDLEKGLAEVRRVVKKRLVILSYDPTRLEVFWNAEYFPEVIEVERRRYPELSRLERAVGVPARVTPVRIPADCADGFQEAFFARPEAFLDKAVRQAQSAWGFIAPEDEDRTVARLARELESGEWDRKYGAHRTMAEFEGAYRRLEFDFAED